MIDAGEGVVLGDGFAEFGRGGEEGGVNVLKFRNPAFDIGPVGVVRSGLRPWVLDTEIGGGVGAGARRPLPTAVV